ncbi:hypothetical protein GE061_006109 [Apolygus lucorum]|uniref:J domain-containing protein n=1 Tax=Apolygus lucorum TaxID=248454 RepID=A0A8S9WUM2_APOLU|nr:hypothetical protein GE061_006109 [Apolygus lucorum]
METHYEVLGCPQSSSFEQLKCAYHDLALKHHPDKNSDGSPEMFSKIDDAWKTLRDPESRKNYDASLKQSEIEEQSLLFGSFSLKDLKYDPTHDVYSCDCRCGGTYSFSKKDFEEFNSYLVGCEDCSLVISVDLQT